jgi:predicted RNase H-like nuclease (RuvC/YqgF family)
MARAWKRVSVVTLLLVFGASTAVAVDPPTTTDLKNQIAALEELVKNLKATVDQVKKDVEFLKTPAQEAALAAKGNQGDIAAMKEAIKTLETKLNALDNKLQPALAQLDSVHRRVSGARPAPELRTTGTIRLENHTGLRTTVMLNNRAYDLMPGETRVIRDAPAGNFDYFVLADGHGQISPSKTRAVVPGFITTIEITPPG